MILIVHFGGVDAYLVHVKRLTKAVVTESLGNVDKLLTPAENSVLVASALMERNVVKVKPNLDLERYFFHHVEVNESVSGMFFGWNNGDFLYVARSNIQKTGFPFKSQIITHRNGNRLVEDLGRNASFDELSRQTTEDDFDPRKRPWYINAKENQLSWTEPYIFHHSQLPGVTVSIPVKDSQGNSIGVLGLDIEVSSLSNYLKQNGLSTNSIALISTSDDILVAHTDLESVFQSKDPTSQSIELAKLSDTKDPLFIKGLAALREQSTPLSNAKPTEVTFDHQGSRYLAALDSYKKHNVNWLLVVITPESDFMADIYKSQWWQLVFAIIGSLLLTLLACEVARRMLKPVVKLQDTVLRDPLTSQYNRRALNIIGNHQIKNNIESDQPMSLAIIDVDRFKSVNDNFGHSVGDEVLVSVSHRIQRNLKQGDLLFRYGGEEFVILLKQTTLEQAIETCERLRKIVKGSKLKTSNVDIDVTISVGVAEIPNTHLTYNDALELADDALYRAKNHGRDMVLS